MGFTLWMPKVLEWQAKYVYKTDSKKNLPNDIVDAVIQFLDIPSILAFGLVNQDLKRKILSDKTNCKWIRSSETGELGASRLLVIYIKQKIFQSKNHPMTEDRIWEICNIREDRGIEFAFSILHYNAPSLLCNQLTFSLQTLEVESLRDIDCEWLSNNCPDLKSLKYFYLGKGNIMSYLANLSSLEELHLPWTTINESLHVLSNLVELHTLNISNNPIFNNEGLEAISHCSKLHNLDLSRCSRITDTGLQVLSGLKLRMLNLSSTSITHVGLNYLKDLTTLQELYLEWSNTSDEILQTLINFTAMKKLSIQLVQHETNASLHLLNQLTELEELTINYSEMKNKDLGTLTFPLLQTLFLNKCFLITDDGLQTLAHWTSLKKLKIHGCTMLRGSVLSSLTNLQELNFQVPWRTRIGAVVKNLTNLRALTLTATSSISDLDIPHLAFLPRLREIHISPCLLPGDFDIDDEDRERFIKIATLRSLRPSLRTPLQLRLTNYTIKPVDEQELRKHFTLLIEEDSKK